MVSDLLQFVLTILISVLAAVVIIVCIAVLTYFIWRGRRQILAIIQSVISGAWWLVQFIFDVILLILSFALRFLCSFWEHLRRGIAGMGSRRNRIMRGIHAAPRQIKRFLLYATQDVWHASMIIAFPILLIFLIRFFVQWESEQEVWREVLADAWDSLWLWTALVSFLLLGIAFLRKHPSPNPRFLKICLEIVLVVGPLLLLSPFLFRMAEKGIRQASDHPLGIATQVPSIGGGQNAPASASDAFTLGVTQKEGKVYATLTGREEKGLTVLLMPPGSTYRVCLVQGKITSYQISTAKNYPKEIWGDSEGYVLFNAQRVGVDLHQNFRYSHVRGVLPYATLAVVGGVGSGQEKVVPFPTGSFCLDATNDSVEVRPLTLYYHAAEFYWFQEGDSYLFPTQTLAVAYGRIRAVKYDGWQDQGKDGSVETFVVVPAASP